MRVDPNTADAKLIAIKAKLAEFAERETHISKHGIDTDNYDDVYSMGLDDGEIELARALLKEFFP